ncbi:MAG TPA: ASKHA domain-containing protein, partial [Spirochaetia bacterium]|nr:ASKHA domain-containing protein [Spirochaetia bacterium]
MKDCVVRFLPDEKEARVQPGVTLLEAAETAGVYVNSVCGGDGLCGKCRLIVRDGEVKSRPTALLDRDEIRQGYVLACESQVLGNLRVEIPPETRLTGRPAFTGEEALRFGRVSPQRGGRVYAFDPLSRKMFLTLPPAGMEDNLSDLDRVYREIARQRSDPVMQSGLFTIRMLSGLLRESDFAITATLGQRGKTVEVVQFERGNTSERNYGVAVDIGTTTIVANLVDLGTGEVRSRQATYNSQIRFGEDVITRILFAEDEPDGLEKLHDSVVKDVNDLINAMVEESGTSLHDVTYVVAAGNTTMIHILLGLEIGRIRKEPYIPVASSVPVIRAAEAGLSINGRGLLCCLPGVGPFVGSDVTADVISAGMNQSPELSLLFDLGTNGEVVLGNSDWLICCSASAGPAFEGGGLKCGIRATDGAIERVAVNQAGKLAYKVIGESRPRGICGSGLIDLAAELFKSGYLDKAGRFVREMGNSHLRDGENGTEFILVPADKTATGRPITVSENDLAIFIRSKGAIYTAAEALLDRVGSSFDEVARVYISGGFGNYVDVGNALAIGLLPDLPLDRFAFIGNGSLNGSRMCLASREALAEAEAIAARTTYFELSTDPKF